MDIFNIAFTDQRLQDKLRSGFNTAPSFRHVCIDNFLNASFAEELQANFPAVRDMKKHYNGINEKKSEESDFSKLHSSFQRLKADMRGDAFIKWLENLTGITDMIVPEDFRGTGIYQGRRGSFLDIHIDFNVHPTLNLQRRVNVLLFFNKDWKEEWGGNLEFWNESVTACIGKFAPVFNRCVIFECSNISYHGYDRITAPANITRKSFYLYSYSSVGTPAKYHDTVFKLKPGVSAYKRLKTAVKEKVKATVKNSLRQTGLQRLLNKLEQ